MALACRAEVALLAWPGPPRLALLAWPSSLGPPRLALGPQAREGRPPTAHQPAPRLLPQEAAAAAAAARQAEVTPISHKSLVKLHTRLKKAITNEKVARGMYENYILRGMRHQQASEAGAQAAREGADSSRGMPAASEQGGTAAAEPPDDHLLACPMLAKHAPLAFRALSVLCLGISVLIIFCEGTIILTGWPLNLHPSPLFHLFRYLSGGGGGVLVLALLYVPMIYCAFCTYFAMFRMKLCDFYALHPRHSDAGSLLFNATYACRFGPALCFNMLKLLEVCTRAHAHTRTRAHAHTRTRAHVCMPRMRAACARPMLILRRAPPPPSPTRRPRSSSRPTTRRAPPSGPRGGRRRPTRRSPSAPTSRRPCSPTWTSCPTSSRRATTNVTRPRPPRRRAAAARRAAAPPPPAPLSLAAPFTFHPSPSTLHLPPTARSARVMPAARTTHATTTTHAATTHVPRSRPRAASFTFNNYAPLLIVILCGCTYLNLFSNMAACCMRCVPCINAQSNSFSFDEDFSDTRIDHGAQILTRERQAMAEGSPLGANLQLLSGATSDGEEASKASARQAPSSASRNLNRWNHLQEDNL